METDKQLKVLFVTTGYPSREHPIRGVFVRGHAKAVGLYDDVVVLHCLGPNRRAKGLWQLDRETNEDLIQGIPTYDLSCRPSPIPSTSILVYVWSVFRAVRQIASGGFRPQIIHAHFYIAGFAAVLVGWRWGIPVVISEHYSSFLDGGLARKEVVKARFAFRRAARVLPVSQALQKGIESYGIQARFRVVPNVVDPAIFAPHPKRPGRRDTKRILSAGFFGPKRRDGKLVDVKGLAVLLEALAQLRQRRDDWHLDIVGDRGANAVEYDRLAVKLGLADKVSFLGPKSRPEMAEFMRQADLFVLPSLLETFSVAVIEALASGTPVLATQCGGPEEIVTDEVGMLVPPRDPTAMAEGLDHILGHLEDFPADRLARYAADRFGPANVGKQIHAVYEECLKDHESWNAISRKT